ncbi:hypothetical protein CBF34_09050 [Vagococcus penaei]|uniref:Uncharacterized protein n=1 Tax=Vagococcus penaei TaxID=633807 RepID=A0A1Q2D5L4_9ENTE|nr:hypothetical protein [Vagococcus penaei]AQP53696.1 hypothetical protein BW732_05220 [Vagococcus penaei]RST99445.1 hypothetical protein CBF34_09050 [Vagococcus penaei]
MESTWQERLNQLQLENSDLYFKLQQSKADELTYQRELNQLRSQVTQQQDRLDATTNATPSFGNRDDSMKVLQDKINQLSFSLQTKEQELLTKQNEIQQLEVKVSNHDRYVQDLKTDFERTSSNNQDQIKQLIQENDALKNDLVSYQATELRTSQEKQSLQAEVLSLKNQIQQLSLDKESIVKEWEVKYHTVIQEKEQLRAEIERNYQVNQDRQNELIQLRNQILSLENDLRESNLEKEALNKTWEERVDLLETERQRLRSDVDNKKRLYSQEKETEINQLNERLSMQQGLVDRMMSTQQETQESWRAHYQQLEESYRQVRSQTTDYENELARLRQENQTLVSQLSSSNSSIPLTGMDYPAYQSSSLTSMPNFETSPVMPTPSYSNDETSHTVKLEEEVTESQALARQYEEELTNLRQMNDELMMKLNEAEEASANAAISENQGTATIPVMAPIPEMAQGTVTPETVPSAEDHDYGDDYYEEDYSYDDDYYYDDSYDDSYYSYDEDEDEDDDLIDYDPETAQEDIDDYFDDTYSSKKIKIPRAEYEACEDQLEALSKRWKQAKWTTSDQLAFKKWAEPKMKRFGRFYRDLDSSVKPPRFLSRKYKMDEDVYNRVKAYALLSRHLEELSAHQ